MGSQAVLFPFNLDDAKSPVYDDEIYAHNVYASNEEVPFAHIESLGYGSFGHVDKVTRKDGPLRGRVYARKTIMLPLDGAAQMIQSSLETEVDLIKKTRHPHVVSVTDTYVYGRSLAIVMTPVAPGNLEIFLHEADRLPMDEAGRNMRARMNPWFSCLATGLTYLHGLGIRHRDIKPANILVNGDRVLLADFGIAVEYQGDTLSTTTDPVGTKLYRAPEISDSIRSGRAADVFSLGAVFLEINCARSGTGFLAKLKEVRRSWSDPSYGANLEKIHEWILDLTSRWYLTVADRRLLCMLALMLDKKRAQRPTAAAVQTCLSYTSFFCFTNCHCISEPLDSGSNLHKTTGTKANEITAAEDDLSLLKKVLELSATRGFYKVGALHEASEYGHETLVFYFLQQKENIEKREPTYGMTPLHVAAANGRTGVVRLLLGHGAQIDVKDRSGRTALYLGARGGHEATVRELVDNGADFQIPLGESCLTPLMGAASDNCESVVLLLLRRGANLNTQNVDGWTALHHAACGGGEEVTRLLLEGGADTTLRTNCQGSMMTALDMATIYRKDGVKRLIESAQMHV